MVLAMLCSMALLAKDKAKVRVACVGNSITYGYGLPDRETESYPSQLQLLLGDGYEVRNFGKNSATLLRHGHKPYWVQPEYHDALAFKPDMVVIHLGVNDTDPRNWPNYSDEFIPDYRDLIDSFRVANPRSKVWICVTTPLTYRHWRFQSGTRDWQAKVNDAIRQVAATTDVGLIDLHAPLYARPDLFVDAVHPDAEGARIIARTVYAALTGDEGGLSFPMLYGDGMVLQRGSSFDFEGRANVGEKVTVTFLGRKHQAVADANGRWKVTFQNLTAGGPYAIEVKAGRQQHVFHDVWIGDVWLCSGQSNMEFTLSQSSTAREDLAVASQQRNLHLFNLKGRWGTGDFAWPDSALTAVNRLQYMRSKGWQEASEASANGFSAVAWHFGRVLADSLKDVPVGIVCNAVGGSTTESWIDRHTLGWQLPDIMYNWYYGDFGQDWARGRALKNIQLAVERNKGTQRPLLQRHPYEPCYLYEAGILPLEGYPLKGICWYQGESNANNMELHERLFRWLVDSWGATFRHVPFYFVQLSSLSRPSWPAFRDSQRRLAEELRGENVFMVVTSDVGDSLDVHPKNKRTVGERLAWQALNHSYDRPIVSEGPEPTGVMAQGNRLVVTFRNAEGLKASGKTLLGFEIAGKDGLYRPASAAVDGGTVVLSSTDVAHPVSVRYGWQPFTRANLVNGAGLPASTFKMGE